MASSNLSDRTSSGSLSPRTTDNVVVVCSTAAATAGEQEICNKRREGQNTKICFREDAATPAAAAAAAVDVKLDDAKHPIDNNNKEKCYNKQQDDEDETEEEEEEEEEEEGNNDELHVLKSLAPPVSVSASEDPAKSCCLAAKRLRELSAHLEHGAIPRSVLYETLEFAASVLDSITTMEQISRVSDEEDGDLSEVQSDAVPNEVRKWLETTFTRNSISQKRKSDDKLKFRSVANAIRAGIVVDRIYRRMSASTPFVSQEVSNLLKSIDDWSFNCFQINQVSQGQVLKSVGYELFNRYGLLYKFKISTTILKNFLQQIELGYTKHKNPYHNNLHAADVTQTVHYMLWQAGLTNWLTDLEIFATLLAAIIHDYLHTGTTNNFHVMSQSDTALIYNDRAVLENFHISQAFTLMRQDDCNILSGLSKDEYREFRSLVIDMVLATDMSSHFQQIKAMKNILNHSDNFNADKSKILSLVIHISDISHPAKDWQLHSQWTSLLMEEFFRQGDREKELQLECSPLCDRDTTLVAESQLGFIEFIVSPSLEICGDVLDRVNFQMAEANARPALPASAKAASVVAAAVVTTAAGVGGAQVPAQNKTIREATPLSVPALTDRANSECAPDQRQPANFNSATAAAATATSGGDQTSDNPSMLSSSSTSSATPPPPPPLQPQPIHPGQRVAAAAQAATVRHQDNSNNHGNNKLTGSSISVASNQSVATVSSTTSATTTATTSASSSSFASSFVSSETLASNLRKMIVSSSASLSRKLNISSTANSLVANATSGANNGQAAPSHSPSPSPSNNSTTPTPATNHSIVSQSISLSSSARQPPAPSARQETAAEFEARQANYRHPVIQCSSIERARSATSGGGSGSNRFSNNNNQIGNPSASLVGDQQLNPPSSATPSSAVTVVAVRGSTTAGANTNTATGCERSMQRLATIDQQQQQVQPSSGLTTAGLRHQASRSAPPLQCFKIQRPWIGCLERNKKMWKERALTEQARAEMIKDREKDEVENAKERAGGGGGEENVAANNNNNNGKRE